MKRCTKCGRELPDGAEFCSGCGAKQEELKAQGTDSPSGERGTSDGKSVGVLVCGILAIVFAGWAGVILGGVAIWLSGTAEKNGKTKAGKICAIIGIVLSALAIAGIVMLGAMFG